MSTTPKPVSSAACEWCGRAVAQNAEGRWYAVKGEERGYDPLTCEASDDARHYPPESARSNHPADAADSPAAPTYVQVTKRRPQ